MSVVASVHQEPADALFLRKWQRLRSGARVRTLDLFAGCGGITLGLETAGFSVAAAVEFDPDASRSWALNFAPKDRIEDFARAKDITRLDPEDVFRLCRHEAPSVDEAIDVLVGGPPCQAFARVGRAKLRDVLDHPQAFRIDPRARLYQRYIAYVKATRPLAILMENVPEVMNHAGRNVPEEVCDVLSSLGYNCRYTLLNAAAYGVPQHRERMFLVAIHRCCDQGFTFPTPTHAIELPIGYKGNRTHAIGDLMGCFLGNEDEGRSHIVPPPRPPAGIPRAWSAKEAISDLPRICALRLQEVDAWPRRGRSSFRYRAATASAYQHLMRQWPGFVAPELITDHVIRRLPRDHRLFRHMRPGMEYPEIHALAEKLFRSEVLPSLRRLGERMPHEGRRGWRKFKARWVPPYDPGKFSNKWWMLRPGRPSRTLMAHLGKDSYSHIHYDRMQARTISVREAARLQSFPDGFRFSGGSMNAALRQIGNAVPPLMAYALGRSILLAMGLRDHDPLGAVLETYDGP